MQRKHGRNAAHLAGSWRKKQAEERGKGQGALFTVRQARSELFGHQVLIMDQG
jgi:hypothetical protein